MRCQSLGQKLSIEEKNSANLVAISLLHVTSFNGVEPRVVPIINAKSATNSSITI